jgi:glycosyltransferase involved in cell wall biosynthesis
VSLRDVLVVVPTYDERENLDELVTGIRTHAPGADLLVVDDGSPDGTADAAAAFGAGVDVLRRGRRMGIGSAYRDGFLLGLSRGYRRFVTMDADLSHDPQHLPALIAASETADLVIGSRYLHGVSVVNWSLQRLALSVAANTYARTITGLPIRDCTSGFQCIRREALEAIDPGHLRHTGYAFLVELKFRAHRHGCRFAEVPIIFVDRRYGSSKLGPRHVMRSMWAMWALRFGRG